MANRARFSPMMLELDCKKEVEKINGALTASLRAFKRKGFVVGISGGIDSSVTLALCTNAVGPGRVLALQMPERHSAEETLGLSGLIADHCGVQKVHENITPVLEAIGFYQRYDNAVRKAIPGYSDGWKSKIVLRDVTQDDGLSFFSVVALTPKGDLIKERLRLDAYLEIVAVTNFKQRVRKMLEYYHADRLNYTVAGTPNRLEYDQGFFVKLGDGAADVKPIAHLYKSQVYQLAAYLGVPEEIRMRPPTTDTYSLAQGQDEFYFSLPYDKMDLCLLGKNNGFAPEEVATAVGLTPDKVERVYRDIAAKRQAARYLHASPMVVETIDMAE